MKNDIHPKYNIITATWACGSTFEIGSTEPIVVEGNFDNQSTFPECFDCLGGWLQIGPPPPGERRRVEQFFEVAAQDLGHAAAFADAEFAIGTLEVAPGATSGDFLDGFLLGTRKALHDSGRPSVTLTIPDVSPRSLGMLIALYERAVGLYASLIGINAYHQPGVEAGKKAAASILDLQKRVLAALTERGAEGATCEELAAAAGSPDDVETAFHLLERLAANAERGVARRDGATPFDAVYSVSGH